MSLDSSAFADFIASGAFVVVSGLAVLLFKRLPREVGQLSRDWYGQPARTGFSAVPGVPERLEKVETTLGELREFVVNIDHEVHPNSGESMADKVNRNEIAMEALQADVTGIHQMLSADTRER